MMFSARLDFGIALGFVAVLLLASLLNKLGDVMFRKGLARPFYLRGLRIHHRDVLMFGLPSAYWFVIYLVLVGALKVIWSAFWTGIETTFLIAGICLALDLALDRASIEMRVRAILPHEVIYLLIPAYVFTHIVAVLP